MSLPTTETSGDARGTSGGEPVKTLSRRVFPARYGQHHQ